MPIRILGVNDPGFESGNAWMVMDRTLPWLQDSTLEHARVSWGAQVDELVVLDTANHRSVVFNLLDLDPIVPANYALLRDRLLALARP